MANLLPLTQNLTACLCTSTIVTDYQTISLKRTLNEPRTHTCMYSNTHKLPLSFFFISHNSTICNYPLYREREGSGEKNRTNMPMATTVFYSHFRQKAGTKQSVVLDKKDLLQQDCYTSECTCTFIPSPGEHSLLMVLNCCCCCCCCCGKQKTQLFG